MHDELIIYAFQVARKKLYSKGQTNPSLQSLAENISNFGSAEKLFTLGERRFRDYYNEALSENSEVNIAQLEVVDGLCSYSGFDSYEHFLNRNVEVNEDNLPISDEPKIPGKWLRKSSYLIASGLIIGLVIYFSVDRQCWMQWKENHYEQVSFDADLMKKGKLKLCKEERLLYFKKVNTDCSSAFFSATGEVKIWYGKNSAGELEYFTDIGLHPETGKSLKPITEYMIKKYVCEGY